VQLCLDQPLIRRADARKLVSLCALADVMLERCLKVCCMPAARGACTQRRAPGTHSILTCTQVSKYNNANYNNVLLEIEQSCKECSASKSTQVGGLQQALGEPPAPTCLETSQVALEEMGLLDMFPYLGQLMGKKAEAEQHAGT
jgi:hypothetical protein